MKDGKSLKSASGIKKILILQTAFIGDVILVTPLLKETARLFPHAQLHFMTIPNSKNVVETLPYISRLWIFDKHGRDRGITGLTKTARILKRENFDLCLVPHRSLRSAFLVYSTGIPRRIGFDKSAGSFLFTNKVKYVSDIHESDRNLNLLKPLGYRQQQKVLPDVYPDEEDRGLVSDWLAQNKPGEIRRLVALAPGSIWPTKRWPAAYWGQLIRLLDDAGFSTVLIGSEQDKILLREIFSVDGVEAPVAMGKFSLRQSAELIRRCALLISNDSAPSHLGVAMRAPVLTIFGPTVPAFGFYPYGASDRSAGIEGLYCRPCSIHGTKKCPEGHFRCMLELKPQTIFKIAVEIINANDKD